jgi:hypothetical protein
MLTVLIIFIGIYVWRDVKDDYKVFFAALFGSACITSEVLTNLSMINMAGNFIGEMIL